MPSSDVLMTRRRRIFAEESTWRNIVVAEDEKSVENYLFFEWKIYGVFNISSAYKK